MLLWNLPKIICKNVYFIYKYIYSSARYDLAFILVIAARTLIIFLKDLVYHKIVTYF